MAERRLQYRVTSGRYTLPAALLVAVLCRLVVQVAQPSVGLLDRDNSLWGQLVGGLPDMVLWWGGLLVHILTAYLLILLNNAYGLIRQRASFQSAVYLLLVSLSPDWYGLQAGHLAGVAIVGSLFFLFRAYRSPAAPTDLFLATGCVGVGALFVPSLTFFVPLYWIGAYSLQALSLRSFFGSLLGWMFPFWFLLGHAWFYGEMELFTAPFNEMVRFSPVFQGFEGRDWGTLAYLLVLFLVAGSHALARGFDDKIRTRCSLRFFVLLCVCLFLAIALQPLLCVGLLSALAVCVSVLVGHLFVLTRGRAANLFFISVLWAGFFIYLLNLWMLS